MKLLYHPIMLEHLVDDSCPEKPERVGYVVDNIPEIYQGLERLAQGSGDSLMLHAPNGEKYLSLVHTQEYIKKIKNISEQAGEGIKGDEDNFISAQTYKAACYAVGGAVHAAKLARQGQKSLVLCRPPGHHARAGKESGFCFFNNAAIAAEYLLQKEERVLIVDTDLHLGDGTLEYVTGKEEVFYFSINGEGLWPHLEPNELPNAEHVFLPAGTDDQRYLAVLQDRLVPTIHQFDPSIIVVSAGFDTFHLDYQNYREALGGGFMLTEKSYKAIWKILDEVLVPYCAVLEGGYDPESVVAGVRSFLDKDKD